MRLVNILFIAALVHLPTVSTASATVLFDDVFSTFTDGNLVGQGGWLQQATSTTLPLQVDAGTAVVPYLGVSSGDNQDASRNFGAVTSGSLYLAARLEVTQTTSGTTSDTSYFLAMRDSNNSFDNFRFATRPGTDPDTFNLRTRGTGQGGNPFVGTGDLPLNTEFTFIGAFNLVASPGFSDWKVYVNPTSLVEADNPIYSQQTLTTGNPPGFASVILSQFTSASTQQSGVRFSQIALATSFEEAAQAIAVPEPSTLALAGLGCLTAVAVGRWRTRRGPAA